VHKADRLGTQTLHSVAALVVEVTAGDGNIFHVIRPSTVSYSSQSHVNKQTQFY